MHLSWLDTLLYGLQQVACSKLTTGKETLHPATDPLMTACTDDAEQDLSPQAATASHTEAPAVATSGNSRNRSAPS